MEGGVGPKGAQLAPRGAESVRAPRIRTEQSVMFTTKQVSEGLWGGEGRQDGREKARADLIVIPRRPWVSLHVSTEQQDKGGRQWVGRTQEQGWPSPPVAARAMPEGKGSGGKHPLSPAMRGKRRLSRPTKRFSGLFPHGGEGKGEG